MTIPFVGGGTTNLDGFFSQRKTERKHPSSRRRVSPGVSLRKRQTTKPFKNANLTPRFKRRRDPIQIKNPQVERPKAFSFFFAPQPRNPLVAHTSIAALPGYNTCKYRPRSAALTGCLAIPSNGMRWALAQANTRGWSANAKSPNSKKRFIRQP